MAIRLIRDCRPEQGFMFWVAPFGTKKLSDGTTFDFDAFYTGRILPACASAGMTIVRADQIYGQGDVTDTAWRGIQKAAVVLVDFTAQSANVSAEFALALALGKRIIVLTQDPGDIPSDVTGHYRYIQYDGKDWQSIDRLTAELQKEIPAILEQSAAEMILVPMHNGGTTPVPGKVIVAELDFVMVLTDDGRRVVLSAADVDYRRIVSDMSRKFPVGSRLQGAFEVDLEGGTKYTLVAGQNNPWPILEAQYTPGSEFTGTVDNVVAGTGVFVHVAHGINGLIPEHKLASRHVNVGDEVDVAITSLDPARRRIGLRLDRIHTPKSASSAPPPGSDRSATPAIKLPAISETFVAAVTKTAPEGQGGFVLLRPESLSQTVMLHCTAMTADLRADLNDGLIEIGEEMTVEVIRLDTHKGKVFVKDRPDLDPEDEAQVA
jgi:predicted RNA-binding protein with RPS1 domain